MHAGILLIANRRDTVERGDFLSRRVRPGGGPNDAGTARRSRRPRSSSRMAATSTCTGEVRGRRTPMRRAPSRRRCTFAGTELSATWVAVVSAGAQRSPAQLGAHRERHHPGQPGPNDMGCLLCRSRVGPSSRFGYDAAVLRQPVSVLHAGIRRPFPTRGGIPRFARSLGACEVVMFHPIATRGNFATLTPAETARVVAVNGGTGRPSCGRRAAIALVLPFENRGDEVGATLSHPHGQNLRLRSPSALDRAPGGRPERRACPHGLRASPAGWSAEQLAIRAEHPRRSPLGGWGAVRPALAVRGPRPGDLGMGRDALTA